VRAIVFSHQITSNRVIFTKKFFKRLQFIKMFISSTPSTIIYGALCISLKIYIGVSIFILILALILISLCVRIGKKYHKAKSTNNKSSNETPLVPALKSGLNKSKNGQLKVWFLFDQYSKTKVTRLPSRTI
jgi:hypothetical protein